MKKILKNLKIFKNIGFKYYLKSKQKTFSNNFYNS